MCYAAAECVVIMFCRIREVAKTHKVVEQELAHSVNASAAVLSEAFPSKPSSPEVTKTLLLLDCYFLTIYLTTRFNTIKKNL